eukprot:gnl/TRDRNA2_/TRDRNA2_180227_c0_seq1.p1 gnl/TRDRNA2_/TRDRNA2_180227_c0~~gnl/TRDRNA2_/TRDRNA2_180227_c0_seq1.p1  ORF type:complete len:413 (-),score=39.87 gnl/TRDRNA2_/TRDRNA2_180227_c0_seq1:160-1338(-)
MGGKAGGEGDNSNGGCDDKGKARRALTLQAFEAKNCPGPDAADTADEQAIFLTGSWSPPQGVPKRDKMLFRSMDIKGTNPVFDLKWTISYKGAPFMYIHVWDKGLYSGDKIYGSAKVVLKNTVKNGEAHWLDVQKWDDSFTYISGSTGTKLKIRLSWPSYWCFPEDAQVNTPAGFKPIGSIRIGDEVLVEDVYDPGRLFFQPVLAFLHRGWTRSDGEDESVAVVHESGTFQATANHIVFTCDRKDSRGEKLVGHLEPGDSLCLASGNAVVPSEVLHLEKRGGKQLMVAPFTSTGTVVVDGVVASNFGSAGMLPMPHDLFYKAFLPLGFYHRYVLEFLNAMTSITEWIPALRTFGVNSESTTSKDLEMHPYVSMLDDLVPNHRLEAILDFYSR